MHGFISGRSIPLHWSVCLFRAVTVFNNIYCIMYLKVAQRVDLRNSHHTHKGNYEVMVVLTNLILVIISQYIRISNHVVHLKLPQLLYVNLSQQSYRDEEL